MVWCPGTSSVTYGPQIFQVSNLGGIVRMATRVILADVFHTIGGDNGQIDRNRPFPFVIDQPGPLLVDPLGPTFSDGLTRLVNL